MTVSIEVFKQAMGSFPAGVTVTAAYDKSGIIAGMTASAFSSVSINQFLIFSELRVQAVSETFPNLDIFGR